MKQATIKPPNKPQSLKVYKVCTRSLVKKFIYGNNELKVQLSFETLDTQEPNMKVIKLANIQSAIYRTSANSPNHTLQNNTPFLPRTQDQNVKKHIENTGKQNSPIIY